jgi:hypothetical protein
MLEKEEKTEKARCIVECTKNIVGKGSNEDALLWITQMDHIIILRDLDHDKIQLFHDKLAY